MTSAFLENSLARILVTTSCVGVFLNSQWGGGGGGGYSEGNLADYRDARIHQARCAFHHVNARRERRTTGVRVGVTAPPCLS